MGGSLVDKLGPLQCLAKGVFTGVGDVEEAVLVLERIVS